MDDLLRNLKEFVRQMEKRFREKEIAGFSGWEEIPKHEYINRLLKNLAKNDFIDVANLAMLMWALEQKDTVEEEITKIFLEELNNLIQNVKDGSCKIHHVETQWEDPNRFDYEKTGVKVAPNFAIKIYGCNTKED